MSFRHLSNGITPNNNAEHVNGHHQKSDNQEGDNSHTNYMDNYRPSSKYSSTPDENHYGAAVLNGRGGSDHEETGFSDSLNGSFSIDNKIPERPKGNTTEALHWDIDQRNDKIQRLNKKLENSMLENVRLTFSEPTRKQIRTSQDMEVQAR